MCIYIIIYIYIYVILLVYDSRLSCVIYSCVLREVIEVERIDARHSSRAARRRRLARLPCHLTAFVRPSQTEHNTKYLFKRASLCLLSLQLPRVLFGLGLEMLKRWLQDDRHAFESCL